MKRNIYIFILFLTTWFACNLAGADHLVLSKQTTLNTQGRKLKEKFSDFNFKAADTENSIAFSSSKKKKRAKCIKPIFYCLPGEHCCTLNKIDNLLIFSSQEYYFLHSFFSDEKRGPPAVV